MTAIVLALEHVKLDILLFVFIVFIRNGERKLVCTSLDSEDNCPSGYQRVLNNEKREALNAIVTFWLFFEGPYIMIL